MPEIRHQLGGEAASAAMRRLLGDTVRRAIWKSEGRPPPRWQAAHLREQSSPDCDDHILRPGEVSPAACGRNCPGRYG
jgi:hypothetical protein